MTYNLQELLIDLGRKARDANHMMFKVSSQHKNNALKRIGEVIWEKKPDILNENCKDIADADKRNISKSKRDRLLLTEDRLKDMIDP